MVVVDAEYESRHVPHDAAELAWARNRPGQHRPPRPAGGERCGYRHDEWGEVVEARVVEWIGLDDHTDPNLYRHVVDTRVPGRPPIRDGAGRFVMEPVPDPWPKALLDTPFGRVVTREARLRGSAGWLPVDWRSRHRPVPPPARLAAAGPRPGRAWRPRPRTIHVAPS